MTIERRQAELIKLSTLVGVEPDQLSYLVEYDVAVLRELREQAVEMLFAADRKRLIGTAKAASMIPSKLLAKLIPALIPPRLAGRVAGLLETEKAIRLASRVPTEYLADLTPSLDPRRVEPIIKHIPTSIVGPVAKALDQRSDYITMGRLVSCLDDAALEVAVAELRDETLLQVAALAEDPARMSEIVQSLPDERLRSVGETIHKQALWQDYSIFLASVDDSARDHVGKAMADLEPAIAADFAAAVKG